MGSKNRQTEFTPQCAWLDLVNSEMWDGFGERTDLLRDPMWIERFMKYWEECPREMNRGAAHSELAKLRTTLRQIVDRRPERRQLYSRELQVLNAELKSAAVLEIVYDTRGLRTEWRATHVDWQWVRSRLVAEFVEAMAGRPHRIKRCANDGCRWAFVDATKGNIRRWCLDRRCGNRDRVRRARARN